MIKVNVNETPRLKPSGVLSFSPVSCLLRFYSTKFQLETRNTNVLPSCHIFFFFWPWPSFGPETSQPLLLFVKYVFFFCFWLRVGICCLLQRINAERITTPAASWRRLDLYSPSIKLPSYNDIHLGIISRSIFNSRHHKQWLSAQQLWFLMTPAVSREGAHSSASLKHRALVFFRLNMMSEKKTCVFFICFCSSFQLEYLIPPKHFQLQYF